MDRSAILRLLQDVCVMSNNFPAQYKIDGIQLRQRDRMTAGKGALTPHGTHNGYPVVVQEIVARSGVSRREIYSQLVIQWQADHPNLLRVKGVFMDGNTPLIVLPYLPGGNPMQILRDARDPQKLLFMFRGVISGVKHLHHHQRPPIIHGNIHTDNLVLDESGNVVLGQFSLSRVKYPKGPTRTTRRLGNNLHYIAPELYPDDDLL